MRWELVDDRRSGADGGGTTDRPLRILVVEDEALIALELECLLADLGHIPVGVASSSEEAIALGTETKPDLALVDVHLLDGPTGIEVARRLGEDPSTTVLFMTANSKRIPADFAGALGVIAKPYTERIVANALGLVAAWRSGRTRTFAPPDGILLAPAIAAPDDEPGWNGA